MKLEPTENGFAIDAADLAGLLGRTPDEMRQRMREGAITTLVERGEDEDAGRSRVTFVDGRRRVRLIVSDDGEVLGRTRVTVAAKPEAPKPDPAAAPREDAHEDARPGEADQTDGDD